jgi:hypothetical protein
MTTVVPDPCTSNIEKSIGKYISYQPIVSLKNDNFILNIENVAYIVGLPTNTNCDVKYVVKD